MAIIHCPECGHEVSDSAISCPQCGYNFQSKENKPIKTESMTLARTGLILILIGYILWSVFAVWMLMPADPSDAEITFDIVSDVNYSVTMWISLPMALVAIVLAIMGLMRKNTKVSTTISSILSIIGFVFIFIMFIVLPKQGNCCAQIVIISPIISLVGAILALIGLKDVE